jgi:hypothetical protein
MWVHNPKLLTEPTSPVTTVEAPLAMALQVSVVAQPTFVEAEPLSLIA